MSSVTQSIKSIKQPRGGYIKPSQFNKEEFEDGQILNENENINSSIVGLVVDYLTRFAMGTDAKEAFKISLRGAHNAEISGQKSALNTAKNLLSGITGLDNNSIINACKIVTYDVWYRNYKIALSIKGDDKKEPDSETIQNIKIMVERSVKFWEKFGPILQVGFEFSPNGYTKTVHAGDGDYLTADTLWDFKVSKNDPKSENTLQLLMYWIMGQHSGQDIYKGVRKLGIFNPRLNRVYLIEIESIPIEIIEEIEKNVICY